MNDPGSSRLSASARRWFRTPPRLHGEIVTDRTVSFLELFYDLVFVVIVAQLAHHLVGHTTWGTVTEFAILFGLIWVGWINGSLYHELHGREDGRHRGYIFLQMYLLIVLAALAGHAGDSDGPRFAVTFAALMLLVTYQWAVVARLDTVPRFRRAAQRYIAMMLFIVAITLVSALVSAQARMILWGLAVVTTVVGLLSTAFLQEDGPEGPALRVTESMVERFGLFTIIVLGEVVTGVINGMVEARASTQAIVVGLLAMTVGFGMWWNYFDALGRRLPRDTRPSMTAYLLLHLPLQGAIAAAGGGMVSLIEHAGEDHLDTGTTWLLSGAVALVLVLIAALLGTLHQEDASPTKRQVRVILVIGAIVALALAPLHLPSAALAAGLSLVLGATWAAAFVVRSVSGELEQLHPH